MYYPSLEEFKRKVAAGMGNLIPVYKEILADMETPVSAFHKISANKYAFLLESVEGGEQVARYSFLGSAPFMVFKSKGRHVKILEGEKCKVLILPKGEDPLGVLKGLLAKYKLVPAAGLPRFCGGAVGYIVYDMVRFFEELPDKTEDDLGLPDAFFAFTDTLLIFDHVKNQIKLVSCAFVESEAEADEAYEKACEKIEKMVRGLGPNQVRKAAKPKVAKSVKATPKSNFTAHQFEEVVRVAKDYIQAGDIIQVVLSQRLEVPVAAEPFDVYRALRSINPSPYMFYLTYGDLKIVGSSPEMLVREEDGLVVTRPIAGTRPRGETEEEDRQLIGDLLSDKKELAEHIMLVDLARNDIGRVCEYGSVEVDELMAIEKYSHVSHIVSNVVGRLAEGKDQFDVLRCCFPAGTVSGAPKIRAMEIIEELEPTKRGPYAGAIGYFSFSGNMDSAITIRTIIIKDGIAYVQAGAGIVADSVPEREYQETLNKAKALTKAIEMAEGGLK